MTRQGLASEGSKASPQEVPLIPRSVLFGNPDKASPALSPDGSKLAFLAPVGGVQNVWVGSADDPARARPVTQDKRRGIRIYLWAYTNEHILYLQDKAGDENWRVYATDLTSGETRDLTPFEGVAAQLHQVSPNFPEEILVGLNHRDAHFHDIYRVNIRTGEMTLVEENPEFVGFLSDDDFHVRFAMRFTGDGGLEILKPAVESGWEPFMSIPLEDTLSTRPVGFDKSGEVLYMIDSRGRDTAAFTALDLKTGEETVLALDSRADVSGFLKHPTEKHIQAVCFNYERDRWEILDQSIADDFTYLGTVVKGDISIASRTLDDTRWIITDKMDNGPARFYLYGRGERKARFLFSVRKDLEDYPLAKMQPVIINSRDSLKLVSYLTLPVGTDPEGRGRPIEPLPMVLYVHGGPWHRDAWGFNKVHQWLANRDYAVLSVNFRGSTGFGKGFINAANMEWAGKMHDDLVDAVHWAVAEGIANRERIAIMGGSFGGYATLVGLTFTPEVFACGVDIVGPSNLVTLLKTIPPYWKPMMELFRTRVGNHETEAGRAFLTERSPLSSAHRIKKPLLIGQGANDPRVKQAESDQIVAALEAKGIPVTYVLYGDEGHGFARPENQLSFFAVAEAFLAQHLEGRREPIGDDFKNSSIKVPVGAEQVEGLASCLPPV